MSPLIERFYQNRGGVPSYGTRIEDFDPVAMQKTLDVVRRVFGPGRYFDVSVQGWEQLPKGPVLIVSNHSGGTSIPDAWGFMSAWYGQLGLQRPLHAMAHEIVLANPFVGAFFARRGVLLGRRDLGVATLREHRRDLIVMPGGDLDTWRPYRDRYKVCFGGRTGYAWLALKAGVPIVPVANAGAHETLVVLARGRRLAKALHLHALARTDIFPVHLSLPWGLAVGPWPHLPPPTKLRYALGAPISLEQGPAEGPPSPASVQELDRRVRAAMQGLLDGLRDTGGSGGWFH